MVKFYLCQDFQSKKDMKRTKMLSGCRAAAMLSILAGSLAMYSCGNKTVVFSERLLLDAEQGDADAQYNLGKCYYEGAGTTQNSDNAVIWWRKAAEQGHAQAQKNLGDCYYYGEAIEKDSVQAVYWLQKAAEQKLAAFKRVTAKLGDITQELSRIASED